jgi:hypothetical protein
LTYFKNAGWEKDWIEAAENIVREEFKRSYAPDSDEGGGNTSVDEGDKVFCLKSFIRSYFTNRIQLLACLKKYI